MPGIIPLANIKLLNSFDLNNQASVNTKSARGYIVDTSLQSTPGIYSIGANTAGRFYILAYGSNQITLANTNYQIGDSILFSQSLNLTFVITGGSVDYDSLSGEPQQSVAGNVAQLVKLSSSQWLTINYT
jgi:hypothetical protein